MTTLYEKIGRRYHPVRDTDAYEGLPNGAYLVVISNGSRSTLRVVDLDAGLEALATVPQLTEWIAAELVEASRSQPRSRPATEKENRAWQAYCDVLGDDATLTMTRDSAWGVARKVAEKLAAKVSEARGVATEGECEHA